MTACWFPMYVYALVYSSDVEGRSKHYNINILPAVGMSNAIINGVFRST